MKSFIDVKATILTISKENMELGNKITEMLPNVSYYDKILQSNATMTVTQIAQDYGMSVMRLNKELESMSIIPCYKPNANRLYFKKSELEEWMTQNPERAWQS